MFLAGERRAHACSAESSAANIALRITGRPVGGRGPHGWEDVRAGRVRVTGCEQVPAGRRSRGSDKGGGGGTCSISDRTGRAWRGRPAVRFVGFYFGPKTAGLPPPPVRGENGRDRKRTANNRIRSIRTEFRAFTAAVTARVPARKHRQPRMDRRVERTHRLGHAASAGKRPTGKRL